MRKPKISAEGNPGNPTGKLWAVFFVSLVTTAAVLYWSYSNFETLTVSVEQLSRSGEEGSLINEILRDIIEAENHIHSFILTADTLSRTQYRGKIEGVRRRIARLRELLSDDTLQTERVDTLQSIFDLKIHYLERYLYVKKLKQSSLFTSEAMNRIAERMNDTAFIDKAFLKREIISGSTVPIEREEIVITPDEFRGINGFLRKLFGRDQTRIDTVRTVEHRTSYRYDVAVDTSIVRDYFRDSTLLAVKDILALVMHKEMHLQERITETELNLMRQNKVFISSIRTVLDQLREREQVIAAAERAQTKALADRSTLVLSAIGFFGISMSGFFIFLILRDITRASHYRRQLELEKGKAEQLARAKEAFLSNMSHEIRTPLHNILGFSSLLEASTSDPKQEVYMKAIRESHHYLSELVNSILDQAKIESGKLELANEPFSLVRLVDELKSVYMYAASAKKLSLEVHVAETLDGFHLVGDGFRIKQVLNNLLSNAVKFTETGKIVMKVNAVKTQDRFDLEISVSDTGTGIEPEKLQAIFEPFVQEKPAIARSFGGTGLGLSISRNLVEAMGGTIAASNAPGGGAVFTVALSLPYIVASEPSQEQLQGPATLRADASVIVVEDDRWNALLLREILSPRVREVRVFGDAREALEFVSRSQQKIDLIFTDINLPHLGGVAFLERLRDLGIHTPAVAVTAHMQKEDIEQLYEKGFTKVCKKPFAVSDIEEILTQHIEAIPTPGSAPYLKAEAQDRVDFSLIRAFSGDDDESFNRLVEELVRNNKDQVEEFGRLVKCRDETALAELSHKMKTTYDTLRLHHIGESLASIEVHARLGNKERIVEISHALYPELVAVGEQIEHAASIGATRSRITSAN